MMRTAWVQAREARQRCRSDVACSARDGRVCLLTRLPRDQTLLLDDLGDAAGADGPPALTDGELEALLHGDRLDQSDRHLGGVTRHNHFSALRKGHDTGHVRGTEVELRPVVVE